MKRYIFALQHPHTLPFLKFMTSAFVAPIILDVDALQSSVSAIKTDVEDFEVMVEFHEPLSQNISMHVMAICPSTIEINSNRAVMLID